MFRSFVKALLGTFLLSNTAAANEVIDGVTLLNEFSFQDTVKANDYLLVYFYKSNW